MTLLPATLQTTFGLEILLPSLFSLALMVPIAQDEAGTEEESSGPELLYPIVVTEAAPSAEAGSEDDGPVDPRTLLEAAVKRMGGGLDKMSTLSFSRESYHWRGDRLAFYGKHETRARFDGGIAGRVDVPSEINPDTGRPLGTAFVANGDDRFMMMNRVVLAQEQHEALATQTVRGEIFFFLAPWLLARERAELAYDGKVTMQGWTASSGGEDPETGGRAAPMDYKQFTATYHKVTALNPEAYVVSVGPTTEFWFDVETGDIAFLRLQFRHKDSYNETPMLMEVVERAEFGGGMMPVSYRASSRGDASVREEILISDMQLDPKIEKSVFRRP